MNDIAAPQSPPSPADVAWLAAIGGVKALVIALAVDAFLNAESPRYHGKGMRLRAIGYAGAMLLVPVAWRARGRRDPYPRALDLAVTLPLLADAGGNAVGIYQRAHVDDAIHFANGALFASVVGALVAPRTRTSWEAAAVATAAGTSAAAGWEIAEWIGLQARGPGHEPDVRRHDGGPHRDHRGRRARRPRDPPPAPRAAAARARLAP